MALSRSGIDRDAARLQTWETLRDDISFAGGSVPPAATSRAGETPSTPRIFPAGVGVVVFALGAPPPGLVSLRSSVRKSQSQELGLVLNRNVRVGILLSLELHLDVRGQLVPEVPRSADGFPKRWMAVGANDCPAVVEHAGTVAFGRSAGHQVAIRCSHGLSQADPGVGRVSKGKDSQAAHESSTDEVPTGYVATSRAFSQMLVLVAAAVRIWPRTRLTHRKPQQCTPECILLPLLNLGVRPVEAVPV